MEHNFDDHSLNYQAFDNDVDLTDTYNTIIATLFVIDMHSLDFCNSLSDETTISKVFDIYIELMMKRALDHPKDFYGLIIYNIVT